MTHILVTLCAQLIVGLAFKRWALGGILASAFYLGREYTQAEYRWISAFGEGRRANMPWWGGFDWQVWNFKSLSDFALPILATVCLYALVLVLQRRR